MLAQNDVLKRPIHGGLAMYGAGRGNQRGRNGCLTESYTVCVGRPAYIARPTEFFGLIPRRA